MQDVEFSAELSESYTFRNCIDFLKTIFSEGAFVFTKNGISFDQSDTCQRIYVQIRIFNNKLKYYILNCKESIFGFDFTKLSLSTSLIGKKDGFKFWKLKNSKDIYLTKVSDKTKINALDTILNKNVPFTVYDQDPDENINFSILASDFADMCKNMGPIIKNNCVTALCFDKGIIFQAGKLITGRQFRFGSMNNGLTEYSTSDVILKVEIKYNHIKALSKINNFSANGYLDFYVKKDIPLKIKTNIGDYGKIEISIKDENTGS